MSKMLFSVSVVTALLAQTSAKSDAITSGHSSGLDRSSGLTEKGRADAYKSFTAERGVIESFIEARRHGPSKADKDKEIQTEVEAMLRRVKTLHDADVTAEFTRELGGIEKVLATNTSEADAELLKEISKVREDLCAQDGFENHEFAACEAFMRRACFPPSRKGKVAKAVPQDSHCATFFRAEAKAKAQAVALGAAPAPGGAAGPGPAPGPAPMGTLFGGKGIRDLPDQGFDGEPVKHQDFDTMLDDWQHEFGPKAQHRSFHHICADFPGNEWCRLHGYYDTAPQRQRTEVETINEDGSSGGGGDESDGSHHSGTTALQCGAFLPALVLVAGAHAVLV